MKALYLLYTALSTLILRIPFWALSALPRSNRARASWGVGRAITIAGLRVFVDTVFQIGLPAAEDPEKAAQTADKTGFVWIKPTPDLIVGEVKRLAELNGVDAQRISGYWYGARGSDGNAGQKAGVDEKIIYQLHGRPLYAFPRVCLLSFRFRWWLRGVFLMTPRKMRQVFNLISRWVPVAQKIS